MIHFIVNPTAGSGKGIKTWRKLEPELICRSLKYDVIFTQYPTQATEETVRLVAEEETPFLAVLGGDGTLHEVLDGVKQIDAFSKVLLSYLPCGSGNDFSRGLGLTKDPVEFARALASANKDDTYRIISLAYGYGSAQDERQNFFVSGGIGFDASVSAEIGNSPLKALANRLHLSTVAYLFLGLKQMIMEKKQPATIIVDGKKRLKTDKLFFLSAHNLPYEGGGFPFAPHANPEQNELAVCIFYNMNTLQCVIALIMSLFKIHKYKKGVALLTCKHIEVISDTCRNVHTDGEVLGYLNHVCFSAGEQNVRFLQTVRQR